MQDSEPAKALFDKWLAPLGQGSRRPPQSSSRDRATDHLCFRAAGVPGFKAIQEYKDYDVRTHHTNVDLYERVSPTDLKQASVVIATVLYQAAMREARFPR